LREPPAGWLATAVAVKPRERDLISVVRRITMGLPPELEEEAQQQQVAVQPGHPVQAEIARLPPSPSLEEGKIQRKAERRAEEQRGRNIGEYYLRRGCADRAIYTPEILQRLMDYVRSFKYVTVSFKKETVESKTCAPTGRCVNFTTDILRIKASVPKPRFTYVDGKPVAMMLTDRVEIEWALPIQGIPYPVGLGSWYATMLANEGIFEILDRAYQEHPEWKRKVLEIIEELKKLKAMEVPYEREVVCAE
jgi:hypothetical protein